MKQLFSLRKENRTIVTAEEHNYLGGFDESISRTVAQKNPVPQEFIATRDPFGESGAPEQLMEKYGFNAAAIVKASEKAIRRKIVQRLKDTVKKLSQSHPGPV